MTHHDPETVVRDFFEAVNSHDEDAFLNAFTETGVVDDWGRVFTGRSAIKAWNDAEFIGARGELALGDVSSEGPEVTVVGDWRSVRANGPSRFVFRVDGAQFTSMTIREG